MRDPFGSMQGFMGQFQGFMRNPMQFMLQRKLNLPQNMNPLQNTSDVSQYLLNNGQMTQAQYNFCVQKAKEIENNPQFQQFIKTFGR